MKKGQASRTAEGAAAARGLHRLNDSPVVFDDPFAVAFTSPVWRTLVNTRVLRWLLTRTLLRSHRSVAAQVISRSRFAEDALDDAITRGIRQYVIIGAGFDSFALRHSGKQQDLRIFELDHPDTQRVKRDRMDALGIALPQRLEFVAVDFERHTVPEALRDSGFDATRPAFFSWLGTTPYLSNEATLATLQSISVYAAPHSEILFDYLVPIDTISASDRKIVQQLQRFAAQRGEPLVGEFDPAQLEAAIAAMGLELVGNYSSEEQAARYFAGRADGLRPLGAAYLAHARVGSPAGSTGQP